MTNHPNRSKIPCRPLDILRNVEAQHPGAWDKVEVFRSSRGKDLPRWPDWCYLPMAGWLAIASDGCEVEDVLPEHATISAILQGLGTWRMTRGIYRFDPEIYAPLIESGFKGDIPAEILLRLPEWGIYIETPEITFGDVASHGVFVSLEWDAKTQEHELRLLYDCADGLVPYPVLLSERTLEAVYARLVREMKAKCPEAPALASAPDVISQTLPLVLYLCSEAPDISGSPRNPEPKKTKNGWKIFAADKPTTWDVGVRIGATIRQWKREETATPGDGTHASPRPHIRRAHWHGFWSGPMDGKRLYALRWLPPIPVSMEIGDELPATIRRVK